MAMEALHSPDAQRWKDVPSALQSHAPSSVQGVPATSDVAPEPELPEEALVAAGEEEAAPVVAGSGETVAIDGDFVVAAAAEMEDAPVAKTPGLPDEAPAPAREVGTTAGTLVVAEEIPEPEEAAPAAALAVGVAAGALAFAAAQLNCV